VFNPVQIAGGNGVVGNGSCQTPKPAVAMADKPAQKASLKEKLEAYRAQVAGTGKQGIEKAKGKEKML